MCHGILNWIKSMKENSKMVDVIDDFNRRTAREDFDKRFKSVAVMQLGVTENDLKDGARFIEDLGADSLDFIEFIIALENEFGIEIPSNAEYKATVKDMSDYVFDWYFSHVK